MITVRVRGEGRVVRELRVSGHAGAAPKGEDLVCAAVSALVETLHIGLKAIDVPGWEAQVAEGDARFRFDPTFPADGRAAVAVIVAGLKDLADTQPRYVRWEGGAGGDAP
ncbi:protein of unknown function [Candidatus Hydrogenisulfobacillus filiaventi]|uniref:Ribosomal processing cysteine protease Prp n=1 Tax=Candidatus Hydrogenisulfobacillus filiaventi TaxID=2707344 RepID=A0A6F8ZJA4_9FIRM|nr:ribosomal-processing cysteine protease Prp [Bacillota bacterium]CAB1129670.1 protein of unknown function [Candidatus Hydrogenisulfobacillus filiaventi]